MQLLARGRDSDVFAYSDGLVLRRYRDGRSAEGEGAVLLAVAELGFPVPVVHDATGPDIVMERVEGPTLAEAMVGGLSPELPARCSLDCTTTCTGWPGRLPHRARPCCTSTCTRST